MKINIILLFLIVSLTTFCNCNLLDSIFGDAGTDPNIEEQDSDNDGIVNASDNCPDAYNPDQSDSDNDGLGDICDNSVANSNPTLNFTIPTNDSEVDKDIAATINASDSDGTIVSVELFINNNLVRKDTSSPYKWGPGSGYTDNALLNLADGSYSLKAVATDNDGGTGTAEIQVTVSSTPPPTNLCSNYPPSDNSFNVGDVIRNYTMYDKNGNKHQMCEYGGGDHYKLMFLAVTASW